MSMVAKLALLAKTKEAQRKLLGLSTDVPFSQYHFHMQRWSPVALFKDGKQGAWYDPSDLSTLFQDTAGTIPVTADGDPIGLMKDKSGNGNHATQPISASRPTYRTDGILHWFEVDRIDDSLVIPLSLGGKTFTLAISCLEAGINPFMLVNSIETSAYTFVATSASSSTTISFNSSINFMRSNGVPVSPQRRNELHAELRKTNVFVGNVTYGSSGWGSAYGYSSYSSKEFTGFKKNTGYIMVEGSPDMSKIEKYLARKSGLAL